MIYKIICQQELNGEDTSIEQVKQALKEMGTLDFDSLEDGKEKLQLADTLQVCAQVIKEIEFDKLKQF